MKNLLFVCTKNQWRSPTAEQLYKKHPKVMTRSRGTSQAAKRVISNTDIIWADVIFVMENKHKRFISQLFRSLVVAKPIIVLDIPDDYHYMDQELVEWLTDSIDAYIISNDLDP